ncbi:hypothetical protein FYK55_02580 [Roseiconus nitratireducens]|uniref:Uncharacterized protein n=1 Tax=Roseiconus nitratireducens TaxID=2605748 RepID=A0A5M6DII5_9BACT|nr:hypothetical protein [Roseiconus nitratireducens]KAA5547301.1 hypothetical protein FYK55_02580 [Roseiconus nitratireducens]
MDRSPMQLSPEEIADIEKHKYFLSEKAGHDVGWDAARKDWEKRFANQLRVDRPESKAPAASGMSRWLDRLLVKAGMK